MITIKADFNHRDDRDRLLLADLSMHGATPFEAIAARAEAVTFVDGEDVVNGCVELDATRGWVGVVDWSTQEVLESYPMPADVVG